MKFNDNFFSIFEYMSCEGCGDYGKRILLAKLSCQKNKKLHICGSCPKVGQTSRSIKKCI